MKKIFLSSLVTAFIIMLSACGSPEETAKKVESPKEEVATEKETKDSSKGLEALEGKSFEELTEEDWNKIRLSKKKFKEFLSEMEKPNENGEIAINKAELVGDNRIEITLNNSDGDTFENALTAPIMDVIIRQLYNHSDYYKETEPTILFKDLSGFKITENSKPIEFEEGEGTTKDLGTFNFGDKVDVNGTIITVNNAAFTDERNEFDETNPEKVLKIDLTVQNSTQEEIFADVGDFEVYDAEGTKMEIYSLDNLMETLQAGKNISGSAFFGVTSKGPYELYFKDFVDEKTAKWIIDIK